MTFKIHHPRDLVPAPCTGARMTDPPPRPPDAHARAQGPATTGGRAGAVTRRPPAGQKQFTFLVTRWERHLVFLALDVVHALGGARSRAPTLAWLFIEYLNGTVLAPDAPARGPSERLGELRLCKMS